MRAAHERVSRTLAGIKERVADPFGDDSEEVRAARREVEAAACFGNTRGASSSKDGERPPMSYLPRVQP